MFNILKYPNDEIGGLYFILRCFYDVQYLPKMPKFYMDILKYANEIFSVSKSKCILWNNSLIRIGNKTIFLKDWYEKGVMYIHDILNDAGAWLSFDQFQIKYDIRTKFLRCFGIINSVKNAVNKYPDHQILIREDKPNINFLSDIGLKSS